MCLLVSISFWYPHMHTQHSPFHRYGFAPANVTCRPGVVNGKGSVCQTITSTTNPGNDQTGCGTWSLSPGRISFTSPPLLDEANNRILAVAQNEADETTIFSINLAKGMDLVLIPFAYCPLTNNAPRSCGAWCLEPSATWSQRPKDL